MANAANIEGLYGVRNELNARGIDNDRIGWNQNTGYVTIDNQNFLKPQANVNWTTYADPTAFDQAYNMYTSNQKLNTAQQGVEQRLNQPAANPYDDQINNILAQFYNKISNQTPYDPYSSPEYAAYQAQAQRSADQGIRAAQESMGAAGFGRSTNLAERAQGIQNNANEYMELQVIPQLRAAHAQQQQQELANLGSYLEALTGQQGRFDTRTQQGLQNTMDYMGYLSGQRNQYADEQYRTGRDTVGDSQWQQAYDRNVLESDRNYDRGVFESDRAFDFQKVQTEWENMFKQQQFDESKAARLWEQAFQEKNFAQQVKDAAASRGLQWASLNQREKERIADEAFREKQFAFEKEKFNSSNSKQANYDFKTDPMFREEIAYINKDPANAESAIRSSAEDLIAQYGYSGYQELLKAASAANPKSSQPDYFSMFMQQK